MCGIAGILNWKRGMGDQLAPMLEVIRHRGPDDEGRFVHGPVAMGMRRLSIIDLAGGHQPISNEDETVTAVFNGEIYNYVELTRGLKERGHVFRTHSDTEVLVHLYEEAGHEFLHKLNGMFAFAIWDDRREQLMLARDRLGIKPLYVSAVDEGLVFGSELKSLLCSGALARRLDARALFDYLIYRYIPGDRTPFHGVHKLLPGHLMLVNRQKTTTARWWDLSRFCGPSAASWHDATQRVRELFRDSVRLRMRSDVPVGAYLSGGLDSSLVTAAAARETDIPVSTFSVGFAGSEFDELPYARSVREHIGTRHHEVRVTPDDALAHLPELVWHLDEPNGDSAMLPSYLVSRLAVQHVKVALSGIGADELFGGYHRYHEVLGKFERLQMLPDWFLRLVRPLFAALRDDWGRKMHQMLDPLPPWLAHLDKTHLFDEAAIRELTGERRRECGGYTREIFQRYPGNDYVNHRMYVDAHSYLPDQILALTDRMSMAVSLEARTPFLDYRLVEYVSQLPGHWKVNGADWKILLKAALGDTVPSAILSRPKWGFASPVRSWMSGSHATAFLNLCRHGQLSRDGLLDTRVLDRLLESPRDLAPHASLVWSLCVLEIWYQLFCVGDPGERPEAELAAFAVGTAKTGMPEARRET